MLNFCVLWTFSNDQSPYTTLIITACRSILQALWIEDTFSFYEHLFNWCSIASFISNSTCLPISHFASHVSCVLSVCLSSHSFPSSDFAFFLLSFSCNCSKKTVQHIKLSLFSTLASRIAMLFLFSAHFFNTFPSSFHTSSNTLFPHTNTYFLVCVVPPHLPYTLLVANFPPLSF